MSQKTEFRQY